MNLYVRGIVGLKSLRKPDSDHVQRALLVAANPFPLSIATLRQIGLDLVAEGFTVDAFDAFPGVVSHLPNFHYRDRLYEKISNKYKRFVLPCINGNDLTSSIDLSSVSVPDVPHTIADLRNATAYGAKVGLAALSSAASLTQIAARGFTSEYGDVLDACWTTAHRAAHAADQLLDGYDRMYVFNGRHAESRPFCDVFERESKAFRYEAGSVSNSYITGERSLHSSEDIASRVRGEVINENAGSKYFTELRSRKAGTDSHKFTNDQRRGYIPDALVDRNIVSMFTTSEDEFFAIKDDVGFGEFATQNDVALSLASICRQSGKALALRLHPHLALKHSAWKDDWDVSGLEALGVEVIMPTDQVDSYALVEASEAVVTCGSTVGIEAAFAGKPTLTVGDHHTSALGISRSAMNRADLAQFVADPSCLEGSRGQAIAFGSYKRTAGIVIPNYDSADNPALARLDGRLVDPARAAVLKLRSAFKRK